MNLEYDFVIVGGGPCGLTCALYLSKLKDTKIALIDENKSLGGCHRVTREGEENFFTEHGPRIYSTAYVNTKNLFEKELDMKWDDAFTKYNFNISNIQGYTLNTLTWKEKFAFVRVFLQLLVLNRVPNESVLQFMTRNKFSEKSKDYIDRICRLTDGADSSKYTLDEFIQLFNQNFFQNLLQPRHPNDEFIFKKWEDKLRVKNNIEILKESKLVMINDENKTVILNDGQKLKYKKLILAVPPKNILPLVRGIDAKRLLFNSYFDYIPVTFHFKKNIQEKEKIWGFPRGEWGIAFVILTNYMKCEVGYEFVISTCVTRPDTKSTFIGKTALQMIQEFDEDGLKAEIYRQLREAITFLPPVYEKSILYPRVFKDSAFIRTTDVVAYPYEIRDYPDVFWVGTQNGKSHYHFTSMESAVENALHFCKKMGVKDIKILSILTLVQALRIVILVFCLIFVLVIIKKQK